MLKKKVIASSIANLTDARYFAGWMVDYISFNIEEGHEFYTSPEDISTFQSWVEGPKYMLEMSESQLADAEKHLVTMNAQGIITSIENINLSSLRGLQVIYRIHLDDLESFNNVAAEGVPLIIRSSSSLSRILTHISEMDIEHEVFIELGSEKITESALLDESYVGIQVHGMPEEKVGFKSFDELDEIFEVLQDF